MNRTSVRRKIPVQQRFSLGRIPRYPIWSTRSILLVSLVVVTLTAVLVFLVGRQSVFIETEITLLVIAASLFVFLGFGLYSGIRVKAESFWPAGFDNRKLFDHALRGGDWIPSDIPDLGFDVGEGCLGVILGLLLTILVTVLLAFAAWLLANVVWGLVVVLALGIFWIFNRSLRQVFARSRTCRGNLPRSLGYAFYHTFLYTGWIFALIWLVHWIRMR